MTEACPFCMTEIPDGASVCRGCGAEKGVGSPGGTRRGHVISTLVALPFLIALIWASQLPWKPEIGKYMCYYAACIPSLVILGSLSAAGQRSKWWRK